MKTNKTGSIFKKSKTNDKPFLSEPHKWECSTCGAMNNESVKYCAACGKSK